MSDDDNNLKYSPISYEKRRGSCSGNIDSDGGQNVLFTSLCLKSYHFVTIKIVVCHTKLELRDALSLIQGGLVTEVSVDKFGTK